MVAFRVHDFLSSKRVPSPMSADITCSDDGGEGRLFVIAKHSPSFMDSKREPVEAIPAYTNRAQEKHKPAGAFVR